MPVKTYIVMLKPPLLAAIQTVVASTVEVLDEHLIFCDAKDALAALFLLEIVQSWNELSGIGP
jgi:hypothetical protein